MKRLFSRTYLLMALRQPSVNFYLYGIISTLQQFSTFYSIDMNQTRVSSHQVSDFFFTRKNHNGFHVIIGFISRKRP